MQVQLIGRIYKFSVVGSRFELGLQVLEHDPSEELAKLIEDAGPMELLGRLVRLTLDDRGRHVAQAGRDSS